MTDDIEQERLHNRELEELGLRDRELMGVYEHLSVLERENERLRTRCRRLQMRIAREAALRRENERPRVEIATLVKEGR